MTNPKDPNSPPIPVPETMEEFREMAREAMALSVKTAAHLEEWGKQQKETEKSVNAAAAASGRNAEGLRELREGLAQTEKLVKTIATVSGRNDENSGRILEQELIAQVERDGKIAWMSADEIFPNLKRRVKRRVVDEFDLFIVNGEEAMVVEIKRVLRAEDVRAFAETDLASFRRHFAGMVGNRVLYGALAFALEEADEDVRKQVRKQAEDAGILLIHVVGESGLEILNPDREKLRTLAP